MATPITTSTTFAGLIRELSSAAAEREMLDFDGRVVRFGEFDQRTDRLAGALAATGVEPGDRVAFLDKNCVEHLELMGAAAKLRVVMVPLNWRLAPAELAFILNDACADVLIVGAEYVPLVDALRGELPAIRTVVVTGGVATGDQVDYESWIKPGAFVPPRVGPDPDDVLLQMYTSGTTGRPKGAMLTNANLLAHIRDLSAAFQLTADSINLVAMPLFHIGGKTDFLIGFAVGATTILLREMDPARIADVVPRRRVTHLFLVPAALRLLVDSPGVKEIDFSSVRMVLYGASPISDTLLTTAMGVLGSGFCQVYGLTESGNVGYLEPRFHDPVRRPELLRSCGRVQPWVETRVVDADGAEVPAGEVGELWLRSVQTMKGYWNNAEGTAAAITPEGWLRTGDAVYFDAEGFMYLHDRIKDVIISGAENVYPAEVENVLMAHSEVADSAVIGVPDERWGEVPHAVVVVRPGSNPSASAIIAHCRSRLASFKCPKTVEFVSQLPRNASGKVLKQELRNVHWAGRDRQVN